MFLIWIILSFDFYIQISSSIPFIPVMIHHLSLSHLIFLILPLGSEILSSYFLLVSLDISCQYISSSFWTASYLYHYFSLYLYSSGDIYHGISLTVFAYHFITVHIRFIFSAFFPLYNFFPSSLSLSFPLLLVSVCFPYFLNTSCDSIDKSFVYLTTSSSIRHKL
jgi:hypothetical protein